MINQLRFHVRGSGAVAEARRGVADLARAVGFDETSTDRVAFVVTEAAADLVNHGPQGQLLARAFDRDGVAVIEVLALDKGPGMVNAGESLRGGYSPAGRLGAIRRVTDEFDIYSIPGKGAALVARLSPILSRPAPLEIGVVCLPKPGEDVCGDAWWVEWRDGHCVILVADGLGHGPDAAAASMAAVNALRTRPQLAPAALIEFAHGALRGTRGAALAVADLDLAHEVRYAGVGNIAGTMYAPGGVRHMISYPGIVGHEAGKVREFAYPWSQDMALIMHSDGLATHWNLDHYPGLAERHPSLIAGVLYRDFARGRDDVAVVVAKKR